jgi:hypothetical protein
VIQVRRFRLQTRAAVFVATACLVVACGAGPWPDTSAPTPPAAALSAWRDFPATSDPRPIVWLTPVTPQGFEADGDYKMAWACGRYGLAPGAALPSAAPAKATVTFASGATRQYGAISAVAALEGLRATAEGANSNGCGGVAPLLFSSATLGEADLVTDRGTARVTAWLFAGTGIVGDIGYPALVPSAIWHGGITQGGSGSGSASGGRVSADGRTLVFGFVGAEASGPCGADYVASAAESDTAVAVAVKAIPHQSGDGICDAVGYPRTVTVRLAQPLGGRVLLDAGGRPLVVCPETGEC